jgi:hypothetical protein
VVRGAGGAGGGMARHAAVQGVARQACACELLHPTRPCPRLPLSPAPSSAPRLTAQVGGPGGAAPLKGLREAGEPGVGGVARSVQHAGLGQHHGDEAHVPGGLFLDTWEEG